MTDAEVAAAQDTEEGDLKESIELVRAFSE